MKRAPGSEGVFDERLADTGAQLKHWQGKTGTRVMDSFLRKRHAPDATLSAIQPSGARIIWRPISNSRYILSERFGRTCQLFDPYADDVTSPKSTQMI
jgi:hypothetical protein